MAAPAATAAPARQRVTGSPRASLRRVLAIAQTDMTLVGKDPTAPIILVLMPLLVASFVKPIHDPVLAQEGYPAANGAEQVVPGMAVMFAFFVPAWAGIAYFREHIWGTWDRLRALPVKSHELLVGKIGPWLTIVVVQQAVLYLAGIAFFDLNVPGSVLALVMVVAAFCLFIVAFMLAAIAFLKTLQQVLAVSNLGAIVWASIGGALTPIDTLPSWAAAVAPITPVYWAMRGTNSVLLDGDGVSAVLLPVGVLLGAALVLFVLAARHFRFDEAKGGSL
jgi:ABC-2 type transport system permease protein